MVTSLVAAGGRGVRPPLTRFSLATLPTPLVGARRLREALGGPLVLIKRDDLTGFAAAGNKARTLEFLVGDATATGRDVLVTGGGPGSNFCAAAAVAARVAGLRCELVVYGSAPAAGEPIHPNLAAAWAAGAHVRFTGRPDREEVDLVIEEIAGELSAAGRRPYAVPRGGACAVGAVAFVHAFEELARELDDLAVVPGAIVVATGSGGTHAGLLAGTFGTGRRWPVIGVTVSRPPSEIQPRVLELARAAASLLDLPPAGACDVQIVDGRGPGFGVPSSDGERASRVALHTEGLILDPVYTAKAFAVVIDLVGAHPSAPIVFWHTGGLAAALHHLEQRGRPG